MFFIFVLRNLLLGLACNESTVGLELDLSCNCLGSLGAHVLESCIHGVRAISSLDISDNGKYQYFLCKSRTYKIISITLILVCSKEYIHLNKFCRRPEIYLSCLNIT